LAAAIARNVARRRTIVQSTGLALRLRRNASRAIARAPRARLYHEAPPASAGVPFGLQAEAAPWQCLTRYITGWAQADPAMIAGAAIEGYRFHDPLVGVFTAQHLCRYFAFLHTQFGCKGVRAQPVFHLHGPMDGSAQGEFTFFREAPQLGLTGIARVLLGPRGVIGETVAYDLNMATGMLRSPHIDAAC
jgi:hypothetical protein